MNQSENYISDDDDDQSLMVRNFEEWNRIITVGVNYAVQEGLVKQIPPHGDKDTSSHFNYLEQTLWTTLKYELMTNLSEDANSLEEVKEMICTILNDNYFIPVETRLSLYEKAREEYEAQNLKFLQNNQVDASSKTFPIKESQDKELGIDYRTRDYTKIIYRPKTSEVFDDNENDLEKDSLVIKNHENLQEFEDTETQNDSIGFNQKVNNQTTEDPNELGFVENLELEDEDIFNLDKIYQKREIDSNLIPEIDDFDLSNKDLKKEDKNQDDLLNDDSPFRPESPDMNQLPALSMYGTDLTMLALQGKLDEAFGRDKELLEMMEILTRRQKNNPVLVGEAGVGKTAIIEMFALKMVRNLVPFVLSGRTIISLDLSRIVAGSRYRGEFELRLQRLLDEVLSQPNIILFIDEIHNISGAGSAEGALDAANILKPILSRSGFQCIGASTKKEYEKIEKDPALNRRFQTVQINEPTIEEATTILFSVRPTLEAYHNILIVPGALEQAVELSARYIYDRFLPDKAIDLVDRAGAAMVIEATRVRHGSVIGALVEANLQKVGALRLEAFRRGDVASEFVFHEVDYAYRNFLLRWIQEDATTIDAQDKKHRPNLNDMSAKEAEKILTGTELRSPISQVLFDEMQLAVLTRVDELLFASPTPRVTERFFQKIADLSDDKNVQIYDSFHLEKEPTITLYRISLCLFGTYQEEKYPEYAIQSSLKPLEMEIDKAWLNLKSMFSKLPSHYFYFLILEIRDFFISYEIKKMEWSSKFDFLDEDIEMIVEPVEILSPLQQIQFEIVQDYMKQLKPVMNRALILSLGAESGLNLNVKEQNMLTTLLGYFSKEDKTGFFADLEDPEILKEAKTQYDFRRYKRRLTTEMIRLLVSKITGVPVQGITTSEKEKLRNLENVLHQRIIGQEEGVAAICKAIRRSRFGIQNPNRPIASFMFCGPTGVGKTEVTKVLASTMFSSERDLIRLDMSEFMEKFAVSRLIGSPPGYVGYEEGGQLTDAVRRKPYSVVLFDEIEKAHPDVLNLLLQILEDGRLTDSQRRLVKFENTILILTSNAAADDIQRLVAASRAEVQDDSKNIEGDLEKNVEEEKDDNFIVDEPYLEAVRFLKSPITENFFVDLRKEIQKEFKKSFKDGPPKVSFRSSQDVGLTKEQLAEKRQDETAKLKQSVMEALRGSFLPEFLNRLDDIIVFRPLSPEEIRRICNIMIDDVRKRVKDKEITLLVDDSVKDKLSREGYDPAFGARPLRRMITKNIEDKIIDAILIKGNESPGRTNFTIHLVLDQNDNIVIKK